MEHFQLCKPEVFKKIRRLSAVYFLASEGLYMYQTIVLNQPIFCATAVYWKLLHANK